MIIDYEPPSESEKIIEKLQIVDSTSSIYSYMPQIWTLKSIKYINLEGDN